MSRFPPPVWKRTFGTIAEKNKTKLRTPQGVSDFIATVQATLADMHATASKDPGKAELDATDVESLRQAVEMLSLIDEPRT
jgi:hypothetical protein